VPGDHRGGLGKAGARLRDVVQTRTSLTRIDDSEKVAAVHGEFFRVIRPANTIMQVVRFIDPEWLVEEEADAAINDFPPDTA
jgi:enamine deaminase RidA (YjgF/YER057c/UK114 family)